MAHEASRWRRTPWVAHFALLTGLLAGARAEAKPPRVLALPYQLLQPNLPEDLGEQTTLVIANEVGQGGVTVVRKDSVVGAPSGGSAGGNRFAPVGDPKAGPRAERMLERAQEYVDDGDIPGASRVLEKAVALLEDNGDAVADLRILSEAYLQLGIAQFREGFEEEADEALARAIHFDPERTLSASDFPPIFIKVFDRARYDVLRRPRGELEIRAPAGAQVLLDGRSMGQGPVKLEGVLPGDHYVRVERPGQPVQAQQLRVGSKKTTVLDFDGSADAGDEAPETPLAGLAANKVSPEHLEAIQSAGRQAGAQFVLLGAVFSTDVAYQIRTGLLDVETGALGRVQNIAFDLDLLSADIEAYKVAADIQAQVKGGALSDVESGPGWVPAPDFKPIRSRRSAGRTRMSVKRAAPRPMREPASIYAEAPAPEPSPSESGSGTTFIIDDDDPRPNLGLDTSATASTQVEKNKEDEGGDDLWWLWVVVGVAAVGAAGAATALVLSEDSSDQGKVLVTW